MPMKSKMAENLNLPSWVSYWILIASILVSMDCIYVLGVSWELKKYLPSVILKLWGWYGESDSQYSESGMKDSNGWIVTQSIFNCLEVLAQLAFLFF